MNDTPQFVSIKRASEIAGLCPATLRTLAEKNQVKCFFTPSGQRRFDTDSLRELCCIKLNPTTVPEQKPEIKPIGKFNFIYSRVSSKKQEDDLLRQSAFLQARKQEYATYQSISDIGSGINFKRKGLSSILDACIQNNIGEVVVTHRDRLSRFGFDLIRLIVEKAGGVITVIDDEQNKTTEQELSEDLLSIIHIYSCRQMGKRKYKNKDAPQNAVY